MTTSSDQRVLATAISERWRQCTQCFESWEEEPERTFSQCPACASLTSLDASSLSGPTGVRAAATATAAQYVAPGALYFSVQGRISRSTWWLRFFLPGYAGCMFMFLIVLVLGMAGLKDRVYFLFGVGYLIFGWLFVVGSIKRWHDHDKSGWWVLIVFIPVLGGLANILVAGFLTSAPGPNRFGPDPLIGTR